jgi:hypothetical protein
MESESSKTIAGDSIIGRSKKQDAAFNSKVATTVLNVFNTKHYVRMGGSPGCEFNPGVAFRFIKGKEVLDAAVCYDCSDILVLTKPRGTRSGGFNGEYEAMKQLAKEAFPRDAEIQKL